MNLRAYLCFLLAFPLFSNAFSQAFHTQLFADTRLINVETASNGDLLGAMYALEAGGRRHVIARWDAHDQLVWARQFDLLMNSNLPWDPYIEESPDGGLYTMTLSDTNVFDKAIVRLRSDGTFHWARKGPGLTRLRSLDNGVLAIGQSGLQTKVYRLDSNGTALWSKTMFTNGGYAPQFWDAIENSQGIYLVGSHFPNGGSDVRGCMVKLNAQGDFEWGKHFGAVDYTIGFQQIEEMSNGFLIVASALTNNKGSSPKPETGLASFDSLGNKYAHRRFRGTAYFQDLQFNCFGEPLMVVSDTFNCAVVNTITFEPNFVGGLYNTILIPNLYFARMTLNNECEPIMWGSEIFKDDELLSLRAPHVYQLGCTPAQIPLIGNYSFPDTVAPFTLTVYGAVDLTADTLALLPFTPNPVTLCDSCAVQAGFDYQMTGSQLVATDTSLGYGNAWEWDFGDGQTSTQQNPAHVYSGAGSYTVCLKVWEGNCVDSTCQQVNVAVGREEPRSHAFEIYPNPTENECWVQWSDWGAVSVSLWHPDGRILREWKVDGARRLRLDTEDLAAGLYLVQWEQAGKREVQKLLVK